MICLIYGGSGSGKSAFAENRIMELCTPSDRRFYLATMQVYDEEGEKKVLRHQNLRKDKGFITLEQPREIEKVLEELQIKSEEHPAVVLLECMSNLCANEMFGKGDKPASKEEVCNQILQGIKQLSLHTRHLVIVSNNVFEDGVEYDDYTKEYIKALGMVNASLADLADEVTEVVVGIPVRIK